MYSTSDRSVLIFFPAGVPLIYSSTPGRYHVPYRSRGATRVGWHGETYCLVGGYRCFGDAPLATPAKAEAKKPGPRRALKRPHPRNKSDVDLGCSSPKIRRLEPGDKKLSLQKLTPAKTVAQQPVPRRALKRRHPGEESDEDLSCSRPKIWRLEPGGKGLSPQKLAG